MELVSLNKKKDDEGKMHIVVYSEGDVIYDGEGYDFGFMMANPDFFYIAINKNEESGDSDIVNIKNVTAIKVRDV